MYDSFDGRCISIWMCVLESFDKSFKADGFLGGWLNGNKP